MGIMVSEVYDAFLAAGAPEPKARAAAEAIPASDQLATQHDIAAVRQDIVGTKADLETAIAKLETRMWKAGITIAGLAVLLNKFLDWAIK